MTSPPLAVFIFTYDISFPILRLYIWLEVYHSAAHNRAGVASTIHIYSMFQFIIVLQGQKTAPIGSVLTYFGVLIPSYVCRGFNSRFLSIYFSNVVYES